MTREKKIIILVQLKTFIVSMVTHLGSRIFPTPPSVPQEWEDFTEISLVKLF